MALQALIPIWTQPGREVACPQYTPTYRSTHEATSGRVLKVCVWDRCRAGLVTPPGGEPSIPQGDQLDGEPLESPAL